MKALLTTGNEFYVRFMVQNNVASAWLAFYEANAEKQNLVGSAIMDLFNLVLTVSARARPRAHGSVCAHTVTHARARCRDAATKHAVD